MLKEIQNKNPHQINKCERADLLVSSPGSGGDPVPPLTDAGGGDARARAGRGARAPPTGTAGAGARLPDVGSIGLVQFTLHCILCEGK